MALLNWDDLFFNPNALNPTAAAGPSPWATTFEPVAPPKPVSPAVQPASWAALDSEPVLSPRVPFSSPPQAEYDAFKAFGKSPSQPPAQSKPGLLGQSFGILSPDEQQQWLDQQYKTREEGLQRIDNLKRLIGATPSPTARRALDVQLLNQERALPNLDQLNAMKEGRAPLPSKTGLRAATENVPRGAAEALLSIPEFVGIVKGYLSDHDVDDDNIVKWSLGAKDYVKGLFPGDVARQNDFEQQLASGLGQIATFYGGGAAAALMKAGPKAVAAVTSMMGASAMGSGGFEEATKELKDAQQRAKMMGDEPTAGELERILKTFGYAAVGTTEAIPIAKTFSRAIPENLGARVAQGIEGAAEEALQEGGSQLASNLITQQTTDPNRPTMEGVAESAAVGGVLGGGMGAAFPGRAGRTETTTPGIEEVDPFIEAPEIKAGEPLSFIDLMPGEGYSVVEKTPGVAAPARALPAPEEAPAVRSAEAADASVRRGSPKEDEYFHGGTYAGGDINGPMFLTKNPDIAQDYVRLGQEHGVPGTQLSRVEVPLRQPAGIDAVYAAAKSAGIDTDNGMPPGTWFDKALHGDQEVNALVQKLRDQGYDHTWLEDGSRSGENVAVAFPKPGSVSPKVTAEQKIESNTPFQPARRANDEPDASARPRRTRYGYGRYTQEELLSELNFAEERLEEAKKSDNPNRLSGPTWIKHYRDRITDIQEVLKRFDQPAADIKRAAGFKPGKLTAVGSAVVREQIDPRNTSEDVGSETGRKFYVHAKPEGVNLKDVKQPSKQLGPVMGYVSLDRAPDGRWNVGMIEVFPKYRKTDAFRALLTTVQKEIGHRLDPAAVFMSDGFKVFSKIYPQVAKWWQHDPATDLYYSPKQLLRMRNQAQSRLNDLNAGEELLSGDKFDKAAPGAVTTLRAGPERTERTRTYLSEAVDDLNKMLAKVPPEAFETENLQAMLSARPEPAAKPAEKAQKPLPEQPFKPVGKAAEGTARSVELSPELDAKQIATQGKILLDAGRTISVAPAVTETVTRVFEELAAEIPANVEAGVMTRVEPAGFDEKGKPWVKAVFTTQKGAERSWLFEWRDLLERRAFYLEGGIFFPRLDPTDSSRDRTRAILRHELVHALRRLGNLPTRDFNRLLGHATDLQMLDQDYARFARATKDPYAPLFEDGVTIREVYGELYRDRPDIEERLAQEAVAHLVELHSHGLLTKEDAAPIQDILDNLRNGAYSAPVARPVPAQAGQGDASLFGKKTTTQEVFHPKIGENGKPVEIKSPSKPTPAATWDNPAALATFVPGAESLGQSWAEVPKTPQAWDAYTSETSTLDVMSEPAWVPTDKKIGAGVVILAPDGRVWLTAPTNAFGGYNATFPKGTHDTDMSLQSTAAKEAWEETGLQVRITGFVGDFERTTSKARYYLAEVTGGTPSDMGWESQAVHLAPIEDAKKLLNNKVDQQILEAALKATSKAEVAQPKAAPASEPTEKANGDIYSAIDVATKASGAQELATDILKDLRKLWKQDYPWAGWSGLSDTKEFRKAFKTALKAEASKIDAKESQKNTILLANLFDIVQNIDVEGGSSITSLPNYAPPVVQSKTKSEAWPGLDPTNTAANTLIHNTIGELTTKAHNLGLEKQWGMANADLSWNGDAIEYAKDLIHSLNKVKVAVADTPASGQLNKLKEEVEDALLSIGVTGQQIYAKLPSKEEASLPPPELTKAAVNNKDLSPELTNAVIKASNLAHEAGGKVSDLFKFAVSQANSKVDSTKDFVGWVKALQTNVLFAQGEAQLQKQSEQLGAISTELLNGLATSPVPAKKGPKPALEWTDAEIDALTDEDYKSAHFGNVLIAIPESTGSQTTQDFKYWAVDEAKKMAKAAGQPTMKPAFIKIIIDQAKALGKLQGEQSKQAAFDLAKLAQDLLPGSAIKTPPSPQPLSLAAAKLVAKNMGDDAAAALEEAIKANKTPNAVEYIKLEGVATQLATKLLTQDIYPELQANLKKLMQGLFEGATNLKESGKTPYSSKPSPVAPKKKYTIEDAFTEAAIDEEAYGTLVQAYDLMKENAEGGVVLADELGSHVEGMLEVGDYVEGGDSIALLKDIVAKLQGRKDDPKAVEKATVTSILNSKQNTLFPTIAAAFLAGIPPDYSKAKGIITETAKNLYENIPTFKKAGPYVKVSATSDFKKALKEQLTKTIQDNVAQGADSTMVENLAVFVASLSPETHDPGLPEKPPSLAGLGFDDLIPAPKLDLTFFSNAGGGTKPKEIWKDSDGNEYLFKPVPNTARFLAYGEAAGGHIARLINPKAPRIWVQELNGRLGSVQEMLPNNGTLKGIAMEDLTLEEAQAIQREHVVDWLISNHDGHANQFLALPDGNVVGIDKGQAFKYFGKDRLATDYHPNQVYGEKEPIYNTFWRAYAKRQLPKVQKRLEEDFTDDLKKLKEKITPLEKYVGELKEKADAQQAKFDNFDNGLIEEASKLTFANNYDFPSGVKTAVQALEDEFLSQVEAAKKLSEDEYWTANAHPGNESFFVSKDSEYVASGHDPTLQKITVPLKNGISVADAEKYLGVDLDNGQKLVASVWGSKAAPLIAALAKAGYDHVQVSPGDWKGNKGGAVALKVIQQGELKPWEDEIKPLARQQTIEVMNASLRYISEAVQVLAKEFLPGAQHEKARQEILDDAIDLQDIEPPHFGAMSTFEYTNEYNQTRNPLAKIVDAWAGNTEDLLNSRYRRVGAGDPVISTGRPLSLWEDVLGNTGYKLTAELPQYFRDLRDIHAPEGAITKKGLEQLYKQHNEKKIELRKLQTEAESIKGYGEDIMFRASNEAIDALQQKLPTTEFLSMLRPYAEGRWPNNPAAADAFLDYARQRKENLAAKFHRFFVELDDVRKRGAKALREGEGYGGDGYEDEVKRFNKKHGTKLTGDEYAAVHYYTGSSYRKLNQDLRKEKPIEEQLPATKGSNNPPPTPSKEWLRSMEYAALLESALNKLPPYKGEVYRGQEIYGDERAAIYPGRVLHTKTFFSTSKEGGFSGNIRFVIQSLTGRFIRELSSHPSENEVLFAPNRNFLVEHVEPNAEYKGSSIIEVHLSELPEGFDFNDL